VEPTITAGISENNVFGESMEVFHQAADLVGLAPRIRLELEQPDYEHIFYVTAHLEDRLVPLAPGEAAALPPLETSVIPGRTGLVPLLGGTFILRPEALRGS
jgi:glutamate dehydrogenase (NAD(P)+)